MSSRSNVKMNSSDVPSELLPPPLCLDPLASLFVSPSSSSFPTTQPTDSTGKGVWIALTKEPLDDWPDLTHVGGALSHVDSTDDSSDTIIKKEDLTRSESVFPAKRHRTSYAARSSHIVLLSWLVVGGTAFKVHDVELFIQHVMTHDKVL